MSNWLVFDEALRPEWEREAAAKVSELLGTDVQVHLSLPDKEDARVAWNENRDLKGRIGFEFDGRTVSVPVALPYRGVFIARSRSNGHAQALTWNSWFGENAGIRLVRTMENELDESDGADDSYCYFRFAKQDGRCVDVGCLRNGRKRKCRGYWIKVGNYEINLHPGVGKDVEAAKSLRLDDRDLAGVPEDIAEKLRRFYESCDKGLGGRGESVEALFDVLVSYLKYAVGRNFGGVLFDHEDLAHRQFISFPRWLLETICQRIVRLRRVEAVVKDGETVAQAFSRETVGSLVPMGILAKTSDTLSPCLIRVQPKNALELCARITCVRRRKMSRKTVERLSEIHRQNHWSFDGRICPIETPESEQVGLTLQLAKGATVAADGQIVASKTAAVQDRLAWGTGLVPFANCNDGARNMMGAKNLRQALPIDGRQAPCVKTGVEEQLKAYVADFVELGICPDCTDGSGAFALGRDLLVAYMPWNGWNVDDAVVVSKSIVKDFSVNVRKHFRQEIGPEWKCVERLPKGHCLENGATIAKLVDHRKREFRVRYLDPTPAVLEEIRITPPLEGNNSFATTFEYEVSKKIPLGVGDKIMGRHGNKGVVALVLDEKDMPRLPDQLGGTPVDIILNPHGILSRKNPAQLLETHLGWLLHHDVDESETMVAENGSQAIGVPEVGIVDHQKVRRLLAEKGLDENGRVKLVLPEGGETENAVVVGYEHIVRLCHIPEQKSQARRGGSGARYSESTGQAVHGRKVGGGQRLGEMEVWALAAQESDALLEEMLGGKSDGKWAEQWERLQDECLLSPNTPRVPEGEPDQGFPSVLKDWLLALGVDAKREGDEVKFRLLKSVDDFKKLKPEATEFCNDEGYSVVRKAAFKCKKCGWGPKGVFTFGENENSKGLKLSYFLRERGYEIDGALVQLGDGYGIKLLKGGLPAGNLDVEFPDYDSSKDWLKARVKPSIEQRPVDWPDGCGVLTCYMQVYMQKDEATVVGAEFKGRKSKNMPAGVLVQLFLQHNGVRSVGDMMLTCPNGHPTTTLRPVEPYGASIVPEKGGLFDPELYGEGQWGFIELPFEVPYAFSKDVGLEDEQSGADGANAQEGPVLSVVPVMPLSYRRPVSATGWKADAHDLSGLYSAILTAKENYLAEKDHAQKEILGKKLRKAVQDLTRELTRRIDDKHGIVRRSGLGRRVDRSARAVIVPNPNLAWDQVGLSVNLLWELLGDECRHVHIDPSILDDDQVKEQMAGWAYLRSEDLPSSCLKDIRSRLEKDPDKLIVLNRQPSLHRDSMQAFHPQPVASGVRDVIQLSPLACKGFAADFDGDEMVAHYPVSSAAQLDARKMTPASRLRSGAAGGCMANFDRDFVSGLELLYERESGAAGGGSLHTILNDACCRDLLDRKYERGKAACFGRTIFEHICACHPERAVEMITRLSQAAFRAVTRDGVSFGFYDLMDYSKSNCDAIALITESGANGAKQLETDIGLAQGMTWKAMFEQSYQARNAMCEKKLGASKSGGLTRQLVLALWPWTIEMEDCGSETHSIVDCKCQHGVCAKCYGAQVYGARAGLLPDGKPIEVGAPVGLLAAQSLGERGTQLTMQAIHGVNDERGFDMKTARRLLLSGGGKKERACYFDNRGSNRENVDRFVKRVKEEKAYAEIDRRHIEMVWRALDKAGAEHMLADLIAGDDDVARRIASKSQAGGFVDLADEGGTMPLGSPFAKVMGNLFGQRKLEGKPGQRMLKGKTEEG